MGVAAGATTRRRSAGVGWMTRCLWWAAVPLVVTMVLGAQLTEARVLSREPRAFAMVKRMPDAGEVQRIVRLKGSCAREVVAAWG